MIPSHPEFQQILEFLTIHAQIQKSTRIVKICTAKKGKPKKQSEDKALFTKQVDSIYKMG